MFGHFQVNTDTAESSSLQTCMCSTSYCMINRIMKALVIIKYNNDNKNDDDDL